MLKIFGKRINIKTFVFSCFLAFLLSYFFVFPTLADNNKLQYVENIASYDNCCGDNALNGGVEGDENQTMCNGTWSLTDGDSPSVCWQSGRDDPYLCCGDDTDEYSKNCSVSSLSSIAWNCVEEDRACCNYTGCVKDGNCYIAGWSEYLGLNPGGNDNNVVCSSGEWFDPDTMPLPMASFCGGKYGVYAGELGVGEYPDTTTLACCSDDANEYYAELCPGVTGVNRKCCNNSWDKINEDGSCVSFCGFNNNSFYPYKIIRDEIINYIY